jgi:hypothetical protein
MTRWLRGSIAVSLAMVPLAWATPASAGPCAPLDLVCQAGQSTGTVEQTAGSAGTSVGDATGTVNAVVEPIVQHVRDTVGGILGSGPPPPPPVPGGGSSGGGPSGGDGPRHGPGDAGGARGGPGSGSVNAVHAVPATTGGTAIGDALTSDLGPRLPSSADRVAAFVQDVQRGIAALVLLLGLAIAFVLIQDRVDRRDPKLRLAPIESDIAEFV